MSDLRETNWSREVPRTYGCRHTMMDYVDDLVATVRRTTVTLEAMSDEDASRRPAPGKWSAKEILGHLIDSAANNHQRFVRVRWMNDLVFPGYEQDDWVAAQEYQNAPWLDLVRLWMYYNLHLARVMASTPESIRTRLHTRHNLDRLAWQPLPRGTPMSLDDFMRDYVGHLHHHLRQIEALRPPQA